MHSPSLRTWLAGFTAAAWAVLAAGCVEEHELFQQVAGAGGMRAGAAGQAGGGAGAGAGSSSSGGTPSGAAGAPATRSPAGGPCTLDSDCESGTWCRGGTCTTCTAAGTCRTGFNLVKRNGCDWCVPPNECTTDADCGDVRCFAGLQCEAGCEGDPLCCYGNHCGKPECGRPTNLDCSIVGCMDGGSCVGSVSVQWDQCGCDDSGWHCDMHDDGGPGPGGPGMGGPGMGGPGSGEPNDGYFNECQFSP
jgi:hypothetical protein